MKSTLKYALMCAMALALLACKKDPVTPPDDGTDEPVDTPKGALWAVGSDDNAAPLFAIDKDTNIELVYRLDKAATEDITVTLTLGGQADVDAYNTAKGLEDGNLELLQLYKWTERYRLLPATNYTLPGALTLTVAKGAQESNKISIPVKYDDALLPTEEFTYEGGIGIIEVTNIKCPFMLPVKVANIAGTVTPTIPDQSLALGVRREGIDAMTVIEGDNKFDVTLDTEYLTVLYLNTTELQPLLADKWVVTRFEDGGDYATEWARTYGNIVNLRVNTVGYDAANKRALFEPSSDMRYVVEHAIKYIHPLQKRGRKVCISIEGGDTGLGFCNLTDTQIDEFVFQVKDFVTKYNLDGVNLFDRNSGYGKAGMPAMNTTSYPKLIKALREALGKDKLLTVTDYEEPTASFHDTAATGGISVGQYIDYAWSGYMSEEEDIQLLDPYGTVINPDVMLEDWGNSIVVSEHVRKPFAGLAKEKYGHFAAPIYQRYWPGGTSPYIDEIGWGSVGMWRLAGYNPNKIIVLADMRTNIQGIYEGSWLGSTGSLLWWFFEGGTEFTHQFTSDIYAPGLSAYGYMLKDW